MSLVWLALSSLSLATVACAAGEFHRLQLIPKWNEKGDLVVEVSNQDWEAE